MKTSLLATILCAILMAEPASAVMYTMVDLGALGGDSQAFGLNNAGQVVGFSDDGLGRSHPFLWENGVMMALGDFETAFGAAAKINSFGHVTGSSDFAGEQHGFLWADGVMTDLGILGGTTSVATSINDSDQIVGYSHFGNPITTHGFNWQNGSIADIGIGYNLHRATGINNAAQIVGTVQTGLGQRGFILDNGMLTVLATPFGGGTEAFEINEVGQVAGYGIFDGLSGARPFLYDNGTMYNIGLPTNATGPGEGYALNNYGHVVGRFESATGGRGFVYRDGLMNDVNDLVIANPQHWIVEEVRDINDSGQIAGWAVDQNQLRHAILLSPVPEPSTFMIAALGFAGTWLLGRRMKRGSWW